MLIKKNENNKKDAGVGRFKKTMSGMVLLSMRCRHNQCDQIGRLLKGLGDKIAQVLEAQVRGHLKNVTVLRKN